MRSLSYNATLEKFAEGIKEVAVQENLPIYDIHALMLDVQTKGKADNKNFAMSDSVHPTNSGQAVMAYGLLKAMGAKDQPSGLSIDTTRNETVTDRCTVKDLKVTKGSVSFLTVGRRPADLFRPRLRGDIQVCANHGRPEPVSLSGNRTRAGHVEAYGEGIEVGSFSSDALAGGINLATLPGPWQKLGEEVNRLSAEQETTYLAKWREAIPSLVPEEGAARSRFAADKDRRADRQRGNRADTGRHKEPYLELVTCAG